MKGAMRLHVLVSAGSANDLKMELARQWCETGLDRPRKLQGHCPCAIGKRKHTPGPSLGDEAKGGHGALDCKMPESRKRRSALQAIAYTDVSDERAKRVGARTVP